MAQLFDSIDFISSLGTAESNRNAGSNSGSGCSGGSDAETGMKSQPSNASLAEAIIDSIDGSSGNIINSKQIAVPMDVSALQEAELPKYKMVVLIAATNK